jgi:hypothetical protein
MIAHNKQFASRKTGSTISTELRLTSALAAHCGTPYDEATSHFAWHSECEEPAWLEKQLEAW